LVLQVANAAAAAQIVFTAGNIVSSKSRCAINFSSRAHLLALALQTVHRLARFCILRFGLGLAIDERSDLAAPLLEQLGQLDDALFERLFFACRTNPPTVPRPPRRLLFPSTPRSRVALLTERFHSGIQSVQLLLPSRSWFSSWPPAPIARPAFASLPAPGRRGLQLVNHVSIF